jgi:predicted RNase H-like nuclease
MDSESGSLSDAFVQRSFERVVESSASVICVDIPIGLLDSPGQRACDVEARRLLGSARGPSVFPPPSRRALGVDDYLRASMLNFELTGRYLNKQAFNIGAKIHEVDQVIKAGMQERVREVHPELSFQALNGGAAMRLSKKTAAGREMRWRLLRAVLPELRPSPVVPAEIRGRCSPDDYIDAIVCAWTAFRVVRGEARCIPAEPELDAHGLRMEMWVPG